MDIKLVYGGRQRIFPIEIDSTGQQLRNQIQKIFNIPKQQLGVSFIDQNQHKINIDDNDMILSKIGLQHLSKIHIKKLGKQIKWEYVFYIQYLGPIIIVPLFYAFGKRSHYQLIHHLAAFMGTTHFIKRQLQTKFVHVFSRKTMPFKRLFINSAHYWILFAFLNSVQLFLFPKRMKMSSRDVIILFIIWIFMQFLNFQTHLQLSSFRKTNKKTRGIPKNWGFKFVSCANYLWEILGWLTFSILTKCYSSFLFTAVSTAQMTDWAIKKHKNYKKQFGSEYPKQRKAIFPFIL